MPKKTKDKTIPPTVITLTLPTPEDGDSAPERAKATLLIRALTSTRAQGIEIAMYAVRSCSRKFG